MSRIFERYFVSQSKKRTLKICIGQRYLSHKCQENVLISHVCFFTLYVPFDYFLKLCSIFSSTYKVIQQSRNSHQAVIGQSPEAFKKAIQSSCKAVQWMQQRKINFVLTNFLEFLTKYIIEIGLLLSDLFYCQNNLKICVPK